ncbi:hypothetical protein F5B22DRAFT_628103 [Xylaria bambusicola]|uniref:uncharacterized protein n=1 Tax=Xylaria bambusicola TaxID=326684 RepID=UPI002007AFCA|nr:uncharacterized protein F5B22DRAFT_628103 [Xylaria bambusicola]KAI0505419.1 hypothetical protein F5B22DRAFT_628103 [Xylaria bambusicola]
MRNVHNIIVPARPKYVRGNQDRTVTQYRELKPKLQHEARRDSQGQTSRELPPAPGQIEPERRIPRSQVPTTLAQPAMSRPAPVRPQVSQLFLPQPALSRSTTPQQVPPYQIPPPLQPLPPHVPDFYYTHGPAFRPEVLQHPVNAVPRVIPGFPPVNAQPQNPGIRLSIEQVRRLRAAPTAQDQQEFLLEVVRAQARHSGDNQFAELMAAMIRPHRFRQRGQSCAGRHGLTGAPTTSGVQPQPTGHGGPVQGGQFASYPPPNHHLSGDIGI